MITDINKLFMAALDIYSTVYRFLNKSENLVQQQLCVAPLPGLPELSGWFGSREFQRLTTTREWLVVASVASQLLL